jgi:uroporphyrinogen-III synthase
MRILVTRPREQAEATAARLAALGHAPLVAPLRGRSMRWL